MQILELIVIRKFPSDINHFWRSIDAIDFLSLPGNQLGNHPFSCPEIRYYDLRNEMQKHVADRFPGAPGTVVLAEPSGYEIEISFRDFASPMYYAF